jgi:CBS domain containing-hemolysin-like protein
LGGFPKTGDDLVVGDYDLHVEAMDGLRVARLKITRVKTADTATTSASPELQKSP